MKLLLNYTSIWECRIRLIYSLLDMLCVLEKEECCLICICSHWTQNPELGHERERGWQKNTINNAIAGMGRQKLAKAAVIKFIGHWRIPPSFSITWTFPRVENGAYHSSALNSSSSLSYRAGCLFLLRPLLCFLLTAALANSHSSPSFSALTHCSRVFSGSLWSTAAEEVGEKHRHQDRVSSQLLLGEYKISFPLLSLLSTK